MADRPPPAAPPPDAPTPRGRGGRTLGLAALVAAALLCLLITLSASLRAPTARRLPALASDDGWRVALPADEAPATWWRVEIRHDQPSDQAWQLAADHAEGRRVEVRWEPDARLVRLLVLDPPPPGLGARPQHLEIARAHHDRLPTKARVVRRDDRFVVALDDETIIDALVPLALGVDGAWTLTGPAAASAQVSVHLDRHRSPGDPVSGLDRARARELLAAAIQSGSEADLAAAARALTILGADARDLAAWLAWQRARMALAQSEPFAADLDAALRALMASEAEARRGLLTHLLPGLVELAFQRPALPAPAAQRIGERRRALDLVGQAATALSEAGTGPELDEHHAAGLLSQLAARLIGAEGQPTPTAAAPWIGQRWRLAAGRIPDRAATPPAVQNVGHDGLDRALQHGLTASGFADPAAVLARNHALVTGDDRLAAIERALAVAPAARRGALEGLLALAGDLPPAAALTALENPTGQRAAPVAHDPLAWALARLLRHRNPGLAEGPATELPPTLERYRRLLSGQPGATLLVFALADDTLPPSEALVAALAMQEVAGLAPEWELVGRLRTFALPLELLLADD